MTTAETAETPTAAPPTAADPTPPADQASIEPCQWEVRPAGIENTRFADPQSFYLHIHRARWRGEPMFVVTPTHQSMGFTRSGRLIYLRDDLNGRHARHPDFETASALARAIADGHLETTDYRTWQQAEAHHWPQA